MRSLLGLLRKEVQHIRRDPRTLAVVLMLPVVQVVLFGFAIRTDVEHRPPCHRRSGARRRRPSALRSRFTAAGVFEHEEHSCSGQEGLEPLFQSGAIQEAAGLRTGFCRDRCRDGRPRNC